MAQLALIVIPPMCYDALTMAPQQPTITIPAATADKLAALGRAMLDLARDMKIHARNPETAAVPFPIPDLTRPDDLPKDQEWFWSETWQQGEQEANEDLKAGRYATFESVDEAIASLQRI